MPRWKFTRTWKLADMPTKAKSGNLIPSLTHEHYPNSSGYLLQARLNIEKWYVVKHRRI